MTSGNKARRRSTPRSGAGWRQFGRAPSELIPKARRRPAFHARSGRYDCPRTSCRNRCPRQQCSTPYESCWPLVRRAADDLVGPSQPERPSQKLARDACGLPRCVTQEGDEDKFGALVFGLGVMLESAASAALRKIDRLQPALEDAAQAALNSILTLHGPLILATTEGRELVGRGRIACT